MPINSTQNFDGLFTMDVPIGQHYNNDGWCWASGGLNTSYMYHINQNDGNFFVLTNDIGMRNIPPYLVGVANDDGSEVVFVGGYNLNDLIKRADSVEFI